METPNHVKNMRQSADYNSSLFKSLKKGGGGVLGGIPSILVHAKYPSLTERKMKFKKVVLCLVLQV